MIGTLVDFSKGFSDVVSSGVEAVKRTGGNGFDEDGGKSAKSTARLGDNAGHGASKMATSIVKGTLVNFPVALTDGLSNMPTLYGEKVRKRKPIDGFKSGSIEAGKVCLLENRLHLLEYVSYSITHAYFSLRLELGMRRILVDHNPDLRSRLPRSHMVPLQTARRRPRERRTARPIDRPRESWNGACRQTRCR